MDAYGLPVGWKILYFGSTNAPNSGALDDWDHDGMINLHEYLAGTNPTNAASLLKIEEATIMSATEMALQWSSVTNKWYAIETSTNLLTGFDGVAARHLPATPTMNTQTVSVDQVKIRYYRVTVEP